MIAAAHEMARAWSCAGVRACGLPTSRHPLRAQGQLAALQQQPQQLQAVPAQLAASAVVLRVEPQAQPLQSAPGLPPSAPGAAALLQPGLGVGAGLEGSRNPACSEVVERTLSNRGSAVAPLPDGAQQAAAAAQALQPGGTGFTPNAGASLDLPPGMESLLPTAQPLAADPASLSAAAAMVGCVWALPLGAAWPCAALCNSAGVCGLSFPPPSSLALPAGARGVHPRRGPAAARPLQHAAPHCQLVAAAVLREDGKQNFFFSWGKDQSLIASPN